MRIDVITAFPRILQAPLNESILKQARRRIELEVRLWDLRDFTRDKHRTIDDVPYGGGPGMILKPEPFFEALEYIFRQTRDRRKCRVIFPTPQGRRFDQAVARELAKENHLIFLCGHYKAVDQRVIDAWVTDEISIGDFILTGGEVPTLAVIDAVVRLIPGVIGDQASAETDSFQNFLLDCPYYTRPEVYRGMRVPEVLLSGHHQNIDRWRRQQRLERTRTRRPDLYEKYRRLRQRNNESP